jgi:hypothetical protein
LNEPLEESRFLLLWQGQTTGPHTRSEIQSLLRTGKIHSLFKINVKGEWVLLRDHLADLDRRPKAPPSVSQPEPPAPAAIVIEPSDRTNSAADSPKAATVGLRLASDDDRPSDDTSGFAIASFALSLFFFVPYINGITWLLALILGHLATAQTEENDRRSSTSLGRLALWLCYVEISFFLVALLWFLAMDIPSTFVVYLTLHGRMLFSVLGTLLGAGLLMGGIRLVTGSRLSLPDCFIATLLPSACGSLALLMVQTGGTSADLARASGWIGLAAVTVAQFLVQMFFANSLLRLPGGDPLGLARAALVSLPTAALFALLGIGYFLLFSVVG